MESIDLDNLDNTRRQEEKENEEEEETDLSGGSDENDLLDSLDWLPNRGRNVNDNKNFKPLKRLFGGRVNEARNIGFFIEDVLLMEKECTNPRFINYLMEKQDFSIKKTLSVYDLITNYEIGYYGEPLIKKMM